jgi:dipeptidyl aminopeptidase/acylaminoacyl peptidase
MLFGHPEVDVAGLRTSKRDGRLLAIGYVTDRPRLHFFDAAEQSLQAGIDRALPGRTNRFVSSDRDERYSILHSSGDTSPPRYFLFDHEQKRLDFLFSAYPELDGVELAPMQPIQYEARDGLVIPGYLTLPVGAGEAPFPLIVHPHGGPWARDVWGWDPVVQFLASRGFAVLQPNFRGSNGYGTEFEERGYGNWGLEMQDDVTDGARWLIEQAIADPDRIGIYGASYGGFTALRALQKEPDLFRAGASFAGVTDIPTLLADDRAYWGMLDDMEQLVGDRWSDREQLAAVSPARNADQIRAPVLVAHGTEDWRVHVKQAHAMADALESAGVEVEAHIYYGEVHGFIDERNKIDFYTKLADFFERHLAPRTSRASAGGSQQAAQ